MDSKSSMSNANPLEEKVTVIHDEGFINAAIDDSIETTDPGKLPLWYVSNAVHFALMLTAMYRL